MSDNGYLDFINGLSDSKDEASVKKPAPAKPLNPTIQPVEEMIIAFDDLNFDTPEPPKATLAPETPAPTPVAQAPAAPKPVANSPEPPQAPRRPVGNSRPASKPQGISPETTIGYGMTSADEQENWLIVFERAKKARNQTPLVKKILKGEFVVRAGNIEVLSDLTVKLGSNAKPLDFFNQSWT